MIKLSNLLKETLNLKAGRIYPEVELIPSKTIKNGYEIIDPKSSNEIGVIVLKKIDGIDNVVYSIFINPEFRNQSYAVPVYVKLTQKLGTICSGEFKKDGTPTSFVSKEANNVWKRLNELFTVEKIPIQGDKFRYCLKKENL
jgi:hypothetical protein